MNHCCRLLPGALAAALILLAAAGCSHGGSTPAQNAATQAMAPTAQETQLPGAPNAAVKPAQPAMQPAQSAMRPAQAGH